MSIITNFKDLSGNVLVSMFLSSSQLEYNTRYQDMSGNDLNIVLVGGGGGTNRLVLFIIPI